MLEYHLETKLKAASNLQREVIREMSELSRQTRNKLPAHLPDSLRRCRTTPLLGFLGSIIGSVAGLVTYEDGKRIENEINDLNRVAANLSHLVGEQTHVIRAQFEEMHGQLEAYEEHQEEFRSQITDHRSQITDAHEYVARFGNGTRRTSSGG